MGQNITFWHAPTAQRHHGVVKSVLVPNRRKDMMAWLWLTFRDSYYVTEISCALNILPGWHKYLHIVIKQIREKLGGLKARWFVSYWWVRRLTVITHHAGDVPVYIQSAFQELYTLFTLCCCGLTLWGRDKMADISGGRHFQMRFLGSKCVNFD